MAPDVVSSFGDTSHHTPLALCHAFLPLAARQSAEDDRLLKCWGSSSDPEIPRLSSALPPP